MKWTQELVWKAVGEVLPNITLMPNRNLPEALKHAAVEFFINTDEIEFRTKGNLVFARYIVREVIKEIHDKGFMEFGNINEYWM